MNVSFSGRVAWVSGGASGIGFATAKALAARGAIVALADVDEIALEEARASLASRGAEAHAFAVDVRDADAVAKAVARVESSVGAIAHAAHAAGVLHLGDLLTLPPRAWEESFAVNVAGTFAVCRSVASRMAERGAGSIVVIASNAGRMPRVGMGAYPATKAAVIQLVRCFGLELASRGVRCNTVSPGSTDTPMQRAFAPTHEDAARIVAGSLERHRLGIPLGRIADPADVASAVLYLLSDEARHITMQDLVVDGGATF